MYNVQVFCVFMMCTAACVFGLILGELQEIYAAANSKVPITGLLIPNSSFLRGLNFIQDQIFKFF
jgi:hypothetical protein